MVIIGGGWPVGGGGGGGGGVCVCVCGGGDCDEADMAFAR